MNEWEWQLLEEKPQLDEVLTASGLIKVGDRVRLQPQRGGDALDLLIQGKTAVVEALEQDYDGRIHLAVVIEEDPGRDLGMLRQPGHRFFFSVEEVERLS
jgi:hypothetical protein